MSEPEPQEAPAEVAQKLIRDQLKLVDQSIEAARQAAEESRRTAQQNVAKLLKQVEEMQQGILKQAAAAATPDPGPQDKPTE